MAVFVWLVTVGTHPSPAVRQTTDGATWWQYLGRIKDQERLGHLPVLRVLDIIGWIHAHSAPGTTR